MYRFDNTAIEYAGVVLCDRTDVLGEPPGSARSIHTRYSLRVRQNGT